MDTEINFEKANYAPKQFYTRKQIRAQTAGTRGKKVRNGHVKSMSLDGLVGLNKSFNSENSGDQNENIISIKSIKKADPVPESKVKTQEKIENVYNHTKSPTLRFGGGGFIQNVYKQKKS